GAGNCPLTPPPVAPSPESFQTTSDSIVAPDAVSEVPPQPRACGAEAGKSTCCRPTVTVTPRAAPSVRICSIWVRACEVHASSDSPQLIEITDGLWVLSCTAVESASMNPWSVLGAK